MVRWPLCEAGADGAVVPAQKPLRNGGGCAIGAGTAPQPFVWPYAVALSSTVAGKQHLVSHAPLRFADPTSFAIPMHRDPRSLDIDIECEAWRHALEVRFPAKAEQAGRASAPAD